LLHQPSFLYSFFGYSIDFKTELIDCVTQCIPFHVGKYLFPTKEFQGLYIDSAVAICLLPLLDAPQPMMSLVERWRQARPVDPITLQTTNQEQAFYPVRELMLILEDSGYVMVEH
ncbi:hypothetical protein VB695_11090, partial [Nodularia spumigena UHCC 0060]|nr:hypothetical protein [Nodularia spumigena UHCC 0060]